MPSRAAFAPTVPTALAVVSVLAAIESRRTGDPALIAFHLALARLGREAWAAGGAAAINRLVREVAAADPDLAVTRSAALRAAWCVDDAFPGDLPMDCAA